MDAEVIVVGAGIAGLACARSLADAGRSVLVLDKGRGVGGRAATRRVEDRPVDHGLPFYHGRDDDFLSALRAMGGPAVEGWPRRVEGRGRPCMRDALVPGETRMALSDGATAFPKALASGLDVRKQTRVASMHADTAGFVLADESGGEWRSPVVVFSPPLPQTARLLSPVLESRPETAAVSRLLQAAGEAPCLTVIAEFGATTSPPEWDAWFPEDSAVLQLISHDSAKRRAPQSPLLVLQAHERWSAAHAGETGDGPMHQLLVEAGRLAGPWASRPDRAWSHLWRFARVPPSARMMRPVLLEFPGTGHLGIAGEAFSAEGGAQGAWRSGKELARRISNGES